MAKKAKRTRTQFPWEYDAFMESEEKAGRLGGRRRLKALGRAEKQRQRARRAREQVEAPLDAGIPKMIRPWPQGWRVPTEIHPMSRKEYELYLTQPHWREFVQVYRKDESVRHECFVCGSEEYDLHHHTYVRLGYEGVEDVVPLCRLHHKAVHKAVKAGVKLANAHTYVRARHLTSQP